MRVLITGADGLLGRAVLNKIPADASVVAFDGQFATIPAAAEELSSTLRAVLTAIPAETQSEPGAPAIPAGRPSSRSTRASRRRRRTSGRWRATCATRKWSDRRSMESIPSSTSHR